MNGYDSILYFNHYEPRYHPRMSMESRSGQFAPFSSLSGYEESIQEEARLVDSYHEKTEESYQILNQKFIYLLENLSKIQSMKVFYFQKDLRKEGGSYFWYQGTPKKMDLLNRFLLFHDSFKISFDQIVDIQFETEEILEN